jgi:hypothetical protein
MLKRCGKGHGDNTFSNVINLLVSGEGRDSEWMTPRPHRQFDALPIFKRDRASALYHFCGAVEMSTIPYTADPDLMMAMGRRVLEASMRAVPRKLSKLPGSFCGANGSVQPCRLC